MLKNSVLPEIVSIQATSLHNFNNVMHTQFHSDQYDLVAKVEAAKLNLPADLLARWKKGIDLEIELNKQTALSTLIKDLDAKNHDRNKTLMQFLLSSELIICRWWVQRADRQKICMLC